MKKLLILFCVLSSSLFAVVLVHDKLDYVINNQPIILNLEARDVDIASVDSVLVYYKGDQDNQYTEAEMTAIPPNKYLLNITPILNGSDQFQYYFFLKMQDGTSYTLPLVFPQENAFVADIKKTENDPNIKLLNPTNKSYIGDGNPVILISYEDPYDILDLKTISLKVDDQDVTRLSNIYSSFINYIPQYTLSQESHKIDFSVKSKDGKEYTIQSSFTYQPKKPSLVDMKGKEELILDLYSTDKSASVISRPNFRMKNTMEMNLKSGFMNMDIYDYETSEETSAQQRQSRTRIDLYDDKGYVRLSLKDSAPVLSQYTLNGINVDGVNMTMSLPGVMSFTYINGDTARTVFGSSDPSNNINGTFTQKLTAYQLSMRVFALDTSLSLLHFKDDMNSLPNTTNWGTSLPQENFVLGMYNKLNLNEDSSSYFKSELAGSVYYSDISTGDTNTIPTEAKKIIPEAILNLIPIRTSMQGGGAAYLEYGTPLFTRDLFFKTNTSLVTKGFKSLGNTSIKNDDFFYGTSLKLNLLRSMISFTGAYQKEQDNVTKLLSPEMGGATTYSDDFKGMANVNVFDIFNLGYNYNLNLKKNDSTQNVSLVDNKTQTHLFSFTNIRLEIGKFIGKLNTNYSLISYEDAVASANSFDQTAIGINVDTEFSPVKAKFSLSKSDKQNKGVTPSMTTYTSYGVRLDYDYIPRVLSTYASIVLQLGLNDGNDPAQRVNNNKTTLGLGGIYKFPGNQYIFYETKLYIDLTIAAAGDKLDTADKTKNFIEQTLIFRLTTTF
ncbi:MAG: hypothetical protein PHV30_05740 [Candidatus Margulisbacteria bacterium]|nr:hypothetical protein [Candidatus Margulisiibacteriota bacterium]